MPLVRKKSGAMPTIADSNDIAALASSYLTINTQVTAYNKEKAKIKTTLENYLEENVSLDGKGNEFTEVRYGSNIIRLQNTIKTSISVKGDAISIIRRDKELKKFADKLIKSVEYVDEDTLEELVESGEISETLAKKLVEMVDSKSFSVKKQK